MIHFDKNTSSMTTRMYIFPSFFCVCKHSESNKMVNYYLLFVVVTSRNSQWPWSWNFLKFPESSTLAYIYDDAHCSEYRSRCLHGQCKVEEFADITQYDTPIKKISCV